MQETDGRRDMKKLMHTLMQCLQYNLPGPLPVALAHWEVHTFSWPAEIVYILFQKDRLI